MEKREAVKYAVIRFIRTVVPQIPAFMAYVADINKLVSFPDWVIPALVLAGGIITATDKFLRDIGLYQ